MIIKNVWADSGSTFSKREQKKTQVNVDLLVLSIVLFRTHGFDEVQRFNSFDFSENLYKKSVTKEDHDKANDIVEYYGKRCLVQQLKTGSLSDFQIKLLDFLNGNRFEYTVDQVGLIHRIPEFYLSDKKLDDIYENNFENKKVKELQRDWLTVDLKFIDSIRVRQRGYGDCINYWFKETNHGVPIRINVDSKNVLGQLWEKHISSSETIILKGILYKKESYNGMEFYDMKKWLLV